MKNIINLYIYRYTFPNENITKYVDNFLVHPADIELFFTPTKMFSLIVYIIPNDNNMTNRR